MALRYRTFVVRGLWPHWRLFSVRLLPEMDIALLMCLLDTNPDLKMLFIKLNPSYVSVVVVFFLVPHKYIFFKLM
jgi:hypothetical protein